MALQPPRSWSGWPGRGCPARSAIAPMAVQAIELTRGQLESSSGVPGCRRGILQFYSGGGTMPPKDFSGSSAPRPRADPAGVELAHEWNGEVVSADSMWSTAAWTSARPSQRRRKLDGNPTT